MIRARQRLARAVAARDGTRGTALFLSLLLAVSPAARTQQPAAPPGREASFVAMSHAFVFYSDRALSLHDFLLWNAHADEPIEPRADCLAGLSSERRTAFERARELYVRDFRGNRSADRLLLALRYRLAGFADVRLVPDEDLAPLLASLDAARPAYDACWWRAHDERNRRWIGELLPRLAANEDALRARLSKLYAVEWAKPIPVDVVGYVGDSGADSVVDPDHIMVSSVDARNGGDAALEVVFHEASHTLFGVGRGPLWYALEQAASVSGMKQPPNFWHALLFFTTGRAVQARLAEEGVAGYEPYVYREALFVRAWPTYRAPLEREWQPYVDGHVPMAEAAKRVLEALGK